ncbi:MAG: Hsp33 family molecular chaperone HslO [Verrucomicrobiales bacterium]|nr:Hsp33 family molecular chaperone HslO [Verrucomicrobiales bacterium]
MLDPELSLVDVRAYFVRHRNALLVRGRMSPMYMDYYMHLMQHQLKQTEAQDDLLKVLLAALVLHLASRPQDESCAWTVNLQKPLMNLFVAGGSRPGRVTGRIFTEDIREDREGLFISQSVRPNHPPRQSMVPVEGADILSLVESFYTQSEQRLTRLFQLDDEEFVQISAEPDCDEAWLEALTQADLADLGEREHLTLLETRGYVFDCGCAAERLYPLIARLPEEDLTFVFEDGVAVIQCPRCGARYHVTRERFDDWREQQAEGGAS